MSGLLPERVNVRSCVVLMTAVWITLYGLILIYLVTSYSSKRSMSAQRWSSLDAVLRLQQNLTSQMVENATATGQGHVGNNREYAGLTPDNYTMTWLMTLLSDHFQPRCQGVSSHADLFARVQGNPASSLSCHVAAIPPLDPRTAGLATAVDGLIIGRSCLTSKRLPKNTPTWSKYDFLQELQIHYVSVTLRYDDPAKLSESSGSGEITLATQCDETRFATLQEVARRWDGPVVAVVYVTSQTFVAVLKDTEEWLREVLPRKNIAVILILRAGPLYPVNRLRNIAIYYSRSEFIFLHDTDFVPSEDIYSKLQSHVKAELSAAGNTLTGLIVPAFDKQVDARTPTSKHEAVQLFSNNIIWQFHHKFNDCGHKAVNYHHWTSTKSVYDIKRRPKCFHCFEPYMIIKTSESPIFPELFAERGKNKLPYYSELCQRKIHLKVLPDVFLVHLNHDRANYRHFNATFHATLDRHLGGCIDASWDSYKIFQNSHK